MTAQQYLQSLLDSQDLHEAELFTLRALRDKVEAQLREGLTGLERVYYAGSFGKRTMIRDRYDLDLVIYWPQNCQFTLKNIHNGVGNVLKKHWTHVTPTNVGWELPFEGGFHLDVVPGRSLDSAFRYANLYWRESDSTLQTSIKVHIDTVRNSGRCDAIRLIKLWRCRKNIPFHRSLALELITIEGCSGQRSDDLPSQVWSALQYIRDNIVTKRIVDPANTNNFLSDRIPPPDKAAIQQAAQAALNSRTWQEVF
jgi:hypothetical protein